MNREQAKEILELYRPGTADERDPDFTGALDLCRQDPELNRWFEEHCAVHRALRSKFKRISVPAGLKEQILSERKTHTMPLWRTPPVLAGFAIVLALATLIAVQSLRDPDPTFPEFQSRMTSTALRTYGMDLETPDPARIRSFLEDRNSIADYSLPAGLQEQAVPTGCVAMNWQGKPVAMICFHSGRPLGPGEKSDLFLFVTERATLPDAPDATSIAPVNRASTATWTEGDRTYFLVADGDEEFLRRFL